MVSGSQPDRVVVIGSCVVFLVLVVLSDYATLIRHLPLPELPPPPTIYLSGESGTSIPPVTFFVGPSAEGFTSKSKISVGNQRVAQALGISTTPLICPCTGAQPRIA